MTTPPTAGPGDLERKVRQLDNDVQAIDGLLADISEVVTGHTLRFDAVDARFDGVDARLETMDGSLREILRRLPEAS